jgi:hypothetical protein
MILNQALSFMFRKQFRAYNLLRAAIDIGHVIVEALLIILPKKSEGQPCTYRHRKLTFTCPTSPCLAETLAASVQLKCTSRRIVTETRPIHNTTQWSSPTPNYPNGQPENLPDQSRRASARWAIPASHRPSDEPQDGWGGLWGRSEVGRSIPNAPDENLSIFCSPLPSLYSYGTLLIRNFLFWNEIPLLVEVLIKTYGDMAYFFHSLLGC